MNDVSNERFFADVPVFTDFERVTDTSNYHPLPDGWFLALADIVGSTQAIAAGRYKDVNMAGVSVISAVLNAVDKGDYPFVFGGDGAVVALPGGLEGLARGALAAAQRWVEEEMGLTLRIAVVPLTDIRKEGLDVRVARHAASPFVTYAMFAGGGASWAERQMKSGRYGVDASPPGTRPDLTGLSCRWSPIAAHNGEIVSIIAVPAEGGRPSAAFRKLVMEVVAISAEQGRGGHPVPPDGPEFAFSMRGVDREARATAMPGKRLKQKLFIMLQIVLVVVLHRLGAKFFGFDARRYTQDVSGNSDFRKFDDGLKMTIDVDAQHLGRIEALLEEAKAKGIARFGLHRQASALMTCFVPTPLSRDHVHFIDGASGGYAVAASQITGKKLSAVNITP
ncbi:MULTISPECIES: DUF3095 domain-containing protein [Rhizobium]|uniref:Adenylate cyclase n=1 Tax=Rhizobium favelukesii TaxID=348824 RepID=W6RK58_9HYPH|nr:MULTISPECIES: DUF3095 domain-containing protein [Rhizobium]MCA0804830.1 DUF3095 domain-containing protein [Rhizobium sp. T1473]MCS0458329.1 DUF3095 domain-containing protein [Rhizobium favelukesii]UFS79790.1 DUF3095 domain-containing protein [Rhizobium sp. T136]CDM61497.1 hypothetical protein LPU83_pLPU83d_0126 [Rhizobium favelukesii]